MKTVLVTGASSGIGEATALRLAGAGWHVFAGVRNVERFTHRAAGIIPIALDVAKPESIAAARATIVSALDGAGLDALVNNAGIGQVLPLEHTTPQHLQEIFSINVFGLLAVTQAFLPELRRSRGRIINISSIGALITIPFGGTLCATKHCVEAFSDALRMELLPDGIEVIAIRPASINSPAANKLASDGERTIAALPAEGQARYAESIRHFLGKMVEDEGAGSPPDVVAETIETALNADKPDAHYFAGKHAHLLSFLGRWVPDHLRDQLLLRKLGLPHESEPAHFEIPKGGPTRFPETSTMSSLHPVIAIDGTAASGKSTFSRALAGRLGFTYVNTGAMYRGVTWHVQNKGITLTDSDAITREIDAAGVETSLQNGELAFRIGGVDPLPYIREGRVNEGVSAVSQVGSVRQLLVSQQQQLAAQAPLVMEGRDIGTVVFPQTPYKFYIDADPEVRAQRRSAQGESDVILQRDAQDSQRKNSPLTCATDALRLDSGHHTVDQLVDLALKHLASLGLKI